MNKRWLDGKYISVSLFMLLKIVITIALLLIYKKIKY